jgi:hypothetical protein
LYRMVRSGTGCAVRNVLVLKVCEKAFCAAVAHRKVNNAVMLLIFIMSFLGRVSRSGDWHQTMVRFVIVGYKVKRFCDTVCFLALFFLQIPVCSQKVHGGMEG